MQRAVTFRNTQTVWLFDYLSFATLSSDANRLIFLSERDWNMIWQATKDIDLWQSRVWVEANGENYLTVDDTQFETFQNWVSDMRIHLGDFEMIEEVLEEIRDALLALVDKPCCPSAGTGAGSRGTGGSQVAPNPYDQGVTPDEPPPGFASMETFEPHKCNAANDIINALGSDLLSLSALSYAAQPPTGVAAVLIGILLTPIPYDDLIALAAYLIWTSISYSFLAEMAAQIELNREDLLCTLYNAPSSEDAQADFTSSLEEIANDQGWSSPTVAFVMGAIDYFMTNDAYNVMFENVPTITQDADCSECSGGTISPWTVVYGTTSSTSPANPVNGGGVFETGYGCGADARHWGISFSEPAKVVGCTIAGGIPSECSGADIFYYYSNDDFTGLISSTSTPPSTAPAVGIRSMYVLWSSTGDNSVVLTQEAY